MFLKKMHEALQADITALVALLQLGNCLLEECEAKRSEALADQKTWLGYWTTPYAHSTYNRGTLDAWFQQLSNKHHVSIHHVCDLKEGLKCGHYTITFPLIKKPAALVTPPAEPVLVNS
jgi:hypothetical protein